MAKLLDSKIDDLEAMIYLNVTALTRLALAALPGFVARKNGLLINNASVVALAPDLLNGDVSGKGIAAALLMANLQASLRSQSGAGILISLRHCSSP